LLVNFQTLQKSTISSQERELGCPFKLDLSKAINFDEKIISQFEQRFWENASKAPIQTFL